jgi:hypothetical protein
MRRLTPVSLVFLSHAVGEDLPEHTERCQAHEVVRLMKMTSTASGV